MNSVDFVMNAPLMKRQSSVKLVYPNVGLVKLKLPANNSSNEVAAMQDMLQNVPESTFRYTFEAEREVLAQVEERNRRLNELTNRVKETNRRQQEMILMNLEEQRKLKEQRDRAKEEADRLRHQQMLARSQQISREKREAIASFQGIISSTDSARCGEYLACFDHDLERAVAFFYDNGARLDIAMAVAREENNKQKPNEAEANNEAEPQRGYGFGAEPVQQNHHGYNQLQAQRNDAAQPHIPPGILLVTVAMPDGTEEVGQFLESDTLWMIYEIVARQAANWGGRPFALVKERPRTHYTEAMLNSTLRAAGIQNGSRIVAIVEE